jgi:excisionase family DNA binding protein
MPSLLTPDEAAQTLNVTRRWIIEAAARGELPGLKLGRVWRFHPEDLDAWVTAQRDRARKEARL